ncbi:hypothetical protein [Streptomyces cavernicola]|uniref:Uncharacterized protein n=1 Tax=Streptomyces cavernicola TaxID=3043613 RepID=A0ABT6SN74_9ACTN|nr:hypothetical protein [Streptomyces sp. B-S-A6]MDI3409384.1 hypothetical protein [Streptomyces sp. B-S-A6]
MLDTTPLTDAVDQFADRLRAAPESRLQRVAAAEARSLARELAVRAQTIEDPSTEPREMPDAGLFAVSDQVTVAGRDLALVLTDEAQLTEAVDLVREAQKRAGV